MLYSHNADVSLLRYIHTLTKFSGGTNKPSERRVHITYDAGVGSNREGNALSCDDFLPRLVYVWRRGPISPVRVRTKAEDSAANMVKKGYDMNTLATSNSNFPQHSSRWSANVNEYLAYTLRCGYPVPMNDSTQIFFFIHQ